VLFSLPSHKFCCYCIIGVEVCRVTHKTASDLDDPSSASFPIGPYCTSGRRCRRQKILPAPWMRLRITWLKTIILDDLKRRKTLSEVIDVAQNRPLWRLLALKVVHAVATATIRLRFDGRSTAYQRSLRSQ